MSFRPNLLILWPAVALACAPALEDEGEPAGSLHGTPLAPRRASDGPLFRPLSVEESGIDVVNRYEWEHARRHLFEHGFAGGGVAIGDVDGDGRPDLYLTRQTAPDALYRQVAPLRFEEVSRRSGIAPDALWSSGAAFADVDRDGDLDLYVCHYDEPNRLYVNRGDGTFEEQARSRGVDVRAASVMATFEDYDRDGDLDLYLVTNRLYPGPGEDVPRTRTVDGEVEIEPGHEEAYQIVEAVVEGERQKYIGKGGQADRLFRNDGQGSFRDVTQEAGLHDRGPGLCATWWDYDDDRWPDLYVGNDYFAPDRLYRNRGDGTFEDVLARSVPHTPWFTMGTAAGDLDGDGRLDLVAADMSPTTHVQSKLMMGDMDRSRWFLTSAEPRQYMRNTVLRNTGTPRFMEVAHLAGLASTDWTWCVKLADLDGDGRQDAFFTNGSANNTFDPDLEREVESLRRRMRIARAPLQERLEAQWSLYRSKGPRRERNLAFRNEGELAFAEVSDAWGLGTRAVSFGAALGDLDRDGDLDLVVSHLDEPVTVYENTGAQGANVLLRLEGRRSGTFGTGARVELEAGGETQVQHLVPTSGFLSSDEPLVHFGLGHATRIERLVVRWPSGIEQRFDDLELDRLYRITEPLSTRPAPAVEALAPRFRRAEREAGLIHFDLQKPFDDFARQPLLPARLSRLGPGLAWGDVDGDGREELFVGGAADRPGVLFARTGEPSGAVGSFAPVAGPWDRDAASEDMAPLFLDVEGDGDLDLFVASGGVEGEPGDALFADRLYLNEGALRFRPAEEGVLPELRESSGSACAADFDRDGDLDLFVGGRSIPGRYPRVPTSRLLENAGGRFVDVTEERAPGLGSVGMVSSALWTDVLGDGWLDLLVACEWGPVSLWTNENGRLVERTVEAGLSRRLGWWNALAAADLDADGDLDYVLTNAGLNTKYRATPDHPVRLYHGLFDDSGRERLLEAKAGEELLPIRGLSCSSHAIPVVRERMPTFAAFAQADLPDIYTQACLDGAYRIEVNELASGVLTNESSAASGPRFGWRPLPRLAQAAPSYGAVAGDLDGDGTEDLYLVQNSFHREPETGRWDGGTSLLLEGDGRGGWTVVEPDASGLVVPGDGKGLARVDVNADGRPDLAVVENGGPLSLFVGSAGAPMVSLRLRGSRGNPTAIGARLTLLAGPGAGRVFELAAGSGYLSQSTPEVHLARPVGTPLTVRVRWPEGSESTHTIEPSDAVRVTLERP